MPLLAKTCSICFDLLPISLLQLPGRTALEGTGPSCLASGCPYCFAGCQWEWGWGLAACLQWSGSWILGLASQPGGLRQTSNTQEAETLWLIFLLIIHVIVQSLVDFKQERALNADYKTAEWSAVRIWELSCYRWEGLRRQEHEKSIRFCPWCLSISQPVWPVVYRARGSHILQYC